MTPDIPALTKPQWTFLCTLEACGQPMALAHAEALAPMDPPSLRQLLNLCLDREWIVRDPEGLLEMGPHIPGKLRFDLEARIQEPFLKDLISRIEGAGLGSHLGRGCMARLLARAGMRGRAGEVEVERAHESLARGDLEEAYRHLSRGVGMLHKHINSGGGGVDRLFCESALELSNLSYAVGRGMRALSSYLETAIEVAKNSGNERTHALACLHLGRLRAYFGRLDQSLALFARGRDEVERLGDSDILKAASEFLGLFELHTGQFRQALIHFEQAEQSFASNQNQLIFYPMVLWNLGITLFFAGQVPRALGHFHSYWLLAKNEGWVGVACIARALLGLALAVARKKDQALYHLQESLQEARANKNAYALFIARAGVAIHLYYENRKQEAFEELEHALALGHKATTAPILSSLFIMDMLPEYTRQREESPPGGWDYQRQLDMAMNQKGFLSSGVGLRLRGEKRIREGENALLAMQDFESSIRHFRENKAEFALNKTLVAVGLLHLKEGNKKEAGAVALKLRRRIRAMGLGEEFLPKALADLLAHGKSMDNAEEKLKLLTSQFIKHMGQLDQAQDEEDLLYEVLAILLQILVAERGALFLPRESHDVDLGFRAGCNLTRQEAESDAFGPCLDLARQAYRENRIISRALSLESLAPVMHKARHVLIMPILAPGHLQGVIYLENIYVQSAFDWISPELLSMGAEHLARYVHHMLESFRLSEETKRLSPYKTIQFRHGQDDAISTRSPAMFKVLDQGERAAMSEATLLVTGETGTGKELLVKRLHKMSRRSAGPLITVDSTTIPENLVESELFGHEKGAFTGADSRKLGRIELAHEGTLFIDEIGELPPQTQVKLLRALETRSFHRVGGTRAVTSDFRLVAATNRSLAREVEEGRFRQDLYYRLNVIHLVLPPLRERGDDAVHLARLFLARYCGKYGYKNLAFSEEDEQRIAYYSWPGNVRELKNVIERAVILSGGGKPALDMQTGGLSTGPDPFQDSPTLEEVQRRYIKKILEKTGGRIDGPNGAAAILGMKRSTLYSRMYKLGLKDVGGKPGRKPGR